MGASRTDYVMLAHKASVDFYKHIDDPGENVRYPNDDEKIRYPDDRAYEKYIEPYYDDGYKEEITKNEHSIHIVSGGMNGGYSMIGIILHKSTQDGIPLQDFNIHTDLEKKLLSQIIKDKFKIDPELKLWVFTHWH